MRESERENATYVGLRYAPSRLLTLSLSKSLTLSQPRPNFDLDGRVCPDVSRERISKCSKYYEGTHLLSNRACFLQMRAKGYRIRLHRISGGNVSTARYKQRTKLQFQLKRVPCSLLSGSTTRSRVPREGSSVNVHARSYRRKSCGTYSW